MQRGLRSLSSQAPTVAGASPVPASCHVCWPEGLVTSFPWAPSGSFTAQRCWAGHFPMNDIPSHPSGGFPANSRSKTLQHPVSFAIPCLTSWSLLQGWEASSWGALSQLYRWLLLISALPTTCRVLFNFYLPIPCIKLFLFKLLGDLSPQWTLTYIPTIFTRCLYFYTLHVISDNYIMKYVLVK